MQRSSFYRFHQIPVRQHVSNDLEMPAKSRFTVPKMSNHSETSFMSSCFVFFSKKEAFHKSPIEIDPKLRCNEMHVNAFGGHVPSKTLIVFESKALSLVLPC